MEERSHANGRGSHATTDSVHGGIAKVDRYKWKTGSQPGELAWIDKGLIDIPIEYQRDQDRQEAKITKIASAFEWPMFGALVVVRRAETTERYYAIDGAGRLSAARKRADVQKVPCVVFKLDSLREEARAFLGLNTMRKPVSAVDKFKPQLAQELPEAVLVEDLAAKSGRKIASGSSPTTISCVACLMRLAKNDRDRLVRLWPLVCDLCRGQVLQEKVVEALMYIDRHMNGPELLTDKKWRTRLMAIGANNVLLGANRAAAYYARGGPKVWAQGVLEVINKGMQERNRLTLQSSG